MAICSVKPVALAALIGIAFGPPPGAYAENAIPLKEAKLNIEHNATDHDTGFQGGIDSEGWKELTVRGPDGVFLNSRARGNCGHSGLRNYSSRRSNRKTPTPIANILSKLPAGNYSIFGPAAGPHGGVTAGRAWLTHVIPAGPILLSPAKGAMVFASDLIVRWRPVTKTIYGGPIDIIAYQLIIEKDAPPHPHMIGKQGSLSMYLPPSVTQITVPRGFLERSTPYLWEVLAIEKSGNQTLSSSEFATR